MTETMTAYRIVEWQHPPELVEVPVPEVGAGQVLIEVAGCGLCHSDLTMTEMPAEIGDALGWQVPFTLGHESAGRVVEVGAGVTTVAVGDPVALTSPSSCGTCAHCRAGRDSACAHGDTGRGYGRDGGLARYVRADSVRDVLPLGALDPRHAGPLTDAGATTHHAVRRARSELGPGSVAVVIGVGGLGSFAVQILRATTEAHIVAVETDPAGGSSPSPSGPTRPSRPCVGAKARPRSTRSSTSSAWTTRSAGASVRSAGVAPSSWSERRAGLRQAVDGRAAP